MYCKHCGKEIADDSKFCQYCGQVQGKDTSGECEGEKIITIPTIKTNLSPNAKKWIWVYAIWFLLNLLVLIFGNFSINDGSFFPFSQFSHLSDYDLSEFFVFTIFLPVLILCGYKLCKSISFSFYIVWFLYNIILLISNIKFPVDTFDYRTHRMIHNYSTAKLFPFSTTDVHYYDYTEFIMYAIILPFLIFWAYNEYQFKKRQRNSQ